MNHMFPLQILNNNNSDNMHDRPPARPPACPRARAQAINGCDTFCLRQIKLYYVCICSDNSKCMLMSDCRRLHFDRGRCRRRRL